MTEHDQTFLIATNPDGRTVASCKVGDPDQEDEFVKENEAAGRTITEVDGQTMVREMSKP